MINWWISVDKDNGYDNVWVLIYKSTLWSLPCKHINLKVEVNVLVFNLTKAMDLIGSGNWQLVSRMSDLY